MKEYVKIRREWIKSIIISLQGPLPSGRIGDCVFLLRDQLQDILDRPEEVDSEYIKCNEGDHPAGSNGDKCFACFVFNQENGENDQ